MNMLGLALAPLSGLSLDAVAQNSITSAEVLTGDLRSLLDNPGKVVGNVKLGWSTKLESTKGVASTLKANYDLRANRNFVKDVSLGGSVSQFGTTLGYELKQAFSGGGFGAATANLKLSTPTVVGLGLGAEYDTKTIDHIQSVSLSSGPYACGDVCKLSGKAEYLGSGKAMKYSGLANFQPKSKYATKLKATLSHAVEAGGPKLSYDAGVEQGVDKGRALSATVKNSKVLALEYADAAMDPTATWTFAWDMPLDAGAADAFLKPKVVVKRKWAL